jgi:hypothetical protein
MTDLFPELGYNAALEMFETFVQTGTRKPSRQSEHLADLLRGIAKDCDDFRGFARALNKVGGDLIFTPEDEFLPDSFTVQVRKGSWLAAQLIQV